MRKAIRRGSAEEEVRKHRDRVTGAWKQISRQRRRVDVRYDPSMVTALQHGTWMDEEGTKKTCIKEKKKRGDIHQPFYGTWVAVLGMAVVGNTPTASFLTKIGKMQSAGCRLCKIAQEARGESTDWQLKHTVTSAVQVVKKWQRQLRLSPLHLEAPV